MGGVAGIHVCNINVVGEWIYYTNESDGSKSTEATFKKCIKILAFSILVAPFPSPIFEEMGWNSFTWPFYSVYIREASPRKFL